MRPSQALDLVYRRRLSCYPGARCAGSLTDSVLLMVPYNNFRELICVTGL